MTPLVLALILVGDLQAADTTMEVRRGDRLVIEQLTGDVTVTAWDRDAVEVRSDPGEGRAALRRSGPAVHVVAVESRGRPRSVEATVRVPPWMEVEIGSRSLDVTVEGTAGTVRIGNVSGDVTVRRVSGPVEVRSMRGEILVTDASGRVRVSSQSDDVTLRRVSGPVEAHSGDGDVVLDDVRAPTVRVEAQDGDVSFSGVIAPGGEYAFFVHDGDATIAVPPGTSARVAISTFDGEFRSDFTVRVDSFTSGRQFDFVLGAGDARIQIEVFDGEIRLLQRR